MDIAQRFFHHSTPQFGTKKLFLKGEEQKITRFQNRHFHFNHKQKCKKVTTHNLDLREEEQRMTRSQIVSIINFNHKHKTVK